MAFFHVARAPADKEIEAQWIFALPCCSIGAIITIFKVIMKPRFPLLLALVAVAQALSSCCELPPLLCCPCYDGGYRPFGRPGSPGEAYEAGYLSGKNDQRNRRCRNAAGHIEEIALPLRGFFNAGYEDGFAGRVRSGASRLTLEELPKHRL